jgi:hypothetical protein
MATTIGLTFTFDEHQHPVSVKCPFCGEEMPPPTPGLDAPLAVILWGTEQFLKHESLKHPESRSLISVTTGVPEQP